MPRGFYGHCHSKIVDKVVRSPYKLRALTGVMVHYCLGCGQSGCVFRADDDLVLKVSAHVGEAPIAEITKGRGRVWPFIPIFYGAWIAPASTVGWNGDDIGVTLREDLVDFSPDHPREFIEKATEFLESASGLPIEDLKNLRRGLGPTLDEMTSFDGKALRMIADFAVWSVNYGLGFDLMEFSGSLAITNLGHSLEDDAVVVRDLGNFDPQPGALERVRRATLQRTRERRGR